MWINKKVYYHQPSSSSFGITRQVVSQNFSSCRSDLSRCSHEVRNVFYRLSLHHECSIIPTLSLLLHSNLLKKLIISHKMLIEIILQSLRLERRPWSVILRKGLLERNSRPQEVAIDQLESCIPHSHQCHMVLIAV